MNRRPPEGAAAWLRLALPALLYPPLRWALGLALGDRATLLLLPAALAWARFDGAPRPRLHAASACAGLLFGVLLGLLARLLPFGLEADPSPLRLVALCAAGPLCEEIVYRGGVLRRGKALLSARAALVLAAALFAAAHGAPLRMLPAFAAGLVFGGAFLFGEAARPGAGLVAAALCHAAANAVQLLVG